MIIKNDNLKQASLTILNFEALYYEFAIRK